MKDDVVMLVLSVGTYYEFRSRRLSHLIFGDNEKAVRVSNRYITANTLSVEIYFKIKNSIKR